MTPRVLSYGLLAYAVSLTLACATLRACVHLDPHRSGTSRRIVSLWRHGKRVARAVVDGSAEHTLIDCGADCTRTVDRVIDDAPLPKAPPLLLSLSIAAGRDGIAATLGKRAAYLTPDDLLALQACRKGARLGKLELRIGLDHPDVVLDALADQLHVERARLLAQAHLRRFIVQREDPAADPWPARTARTDAVNERTLTQSVRSAVAYLVRNQTADGHFGYEIDAVSGEASRGYSWPRHGGAALMLAQAASQLHDRAAQQAALRAARLVQRSVTQQCGRFRCVGDTPSVDAGSTALALMVDAELTRSGISREFADDVPALAGFLRSLQRPDGEFMHVYDRTRQRAIDVQLPYYTGEVVLALARAAQVTGNPADVRAASAGLSHLVRRSIFQNRYLYSTEHWTCQAIEALWQRAPNPAALRFCLDFQRFNRQFQTGPRSEFGDYEGAIARNPFSPPRITPTGSRSEAAVATLATAIAAHTDVSEIASLHRQIRRSLAFLQRFQFRPGPTYLMRDPQRMAGGWPGSPTDLRVRVDFQQHVVDAMLRYLRLLRDPHASAVLQGLR